MKMAFTYSVVQDLMYHILAHMKVKNASDLYAGAYIDHMLSIKNNQYENITEKASHLSHYYNENFERLGVINFLPLVCSSVQELIDATENYDGFTGADRQAFVFPLIQLIKSEFAFYEGYWNKLFDATAIGRKAFESWLKKEMSKYENIFAHFDKSAVVGLSFSLTRNGRGYGDAASFNAVVPFPFDESKYKHTFYQILHEYTHQFTDSLLGEGISMEDGTHDLSERAVLLFDYYLIKKMHEEDTDSYLKWVGSLTNADHCDEKFLLSAYQIDDALREELLASVEQIMSA